MTNEEIQQRIELVQEEIETIKNMQSLTEDEEIAKCYDGLIDDLELIIINLPVPESEREYQERLQQDMDTIKDLEDAQR